MSVNLEIHVGLWIPKSVPYTAISASLRSRSVGSLLGPICCSVTMTRNVSPSSILWRPWMPVASCRAPCGGSSVSSTSAIRLLRVGSQPGELDAGCLADDAASAVAPDEIARPQRPAVGQLDVDAGVVLREARHLASVVDPHRQLGDPGGHDPLDLVLEDREEVRMTRRQVAHVQHGRAERHGPMHLTLREEAIGDPTLIEHLDRARVEAAGARAGEHVIGTPLDDRDVDLRQRQLGRQHHPRRPSSGDHHSMLGHPHSLLASPSGSGLRRAIMRQDRGLMKASCAV